jgi:CDP-diacylglycerol--glycerol-3-phosphate 3-phosphatidyltransferase
MLDRRWRPGVERGLRPVGGHLRSIGVSADALTVLGLVLSIVTAWLIATGRLGLAVAGVIAAGVADLLDGAIARGSGQASPRGAFFDSVADRVSDAVLLIGVGWYLADESAYLPMLAMGVLASSMLISYERAKAESLGFAAKGGLMERAERFVALSIGLAFGILVPVLWVMLALTGFTAIQRFRRVWQQADKPPRPVITMHFRPSARRAESGGAVPRWWAARRANRAPRERRPRRSRARRSARP